MRNGRFVRLPLPAALLDFLCVVPLLCLARPLSAGRAFFAPLKVERGSKGEKTFTQTRKNKMVAQFDMLSPSNPVILPRRSPSVVEYLRRGRTDYCAEVINITPRIATELLQYHNPCNRKLYERRAEYYAEEMRRGYWKRSSGALGIDTNHDITNGQHRLRAVALAGVTIPFIVAFNCDVDSRSVEDCGKARTEADRLGLSGTPTSSLEVAIAKVFHNMPSSAASQKICTEILRGVINTHKEVIELFSGICHDTILQHSVIIGCLCRAAIHIGHQRVEEFCTVAKAGYAESKEDQAAAAFHAWLNKPLAKELRKAGGTQRYRLYCFTQSVIYAFAQRRTLESIRETERDLFPNPDAS